MLSLLIELGLLGGFLFLFFGGDQIDRLFGKKTEDKKTFTSKIEVVPLIKDTTKKESPRKPLPEIPVTSPDKPIKKWVIEDPKNTPKPVVKFDPSTIQIDKTAPSFSDRKRSIHETLLKQSNLNPYVKPVFAKKVSKEPTKVIVSEKEIIDTMIAYEKDFASRMDTLEKVFLAFFNTKPPNSEINQLYDCCKRLGQAVVDLKPIHARIHNKLEKGELDMFGLDPNDFTYYVRYLRGHKGLRLFLNVLVTKSTACKGFMTTFNKLSKSSVTFEEICTLPALELSKYYKFYQEWMLVRVKDASIIKTGTDKVKKFLDENSTYIQEIYQQGKILGIQALLDIPDIAFINYSGTARRSKASKYFWDGVLEIQKQSSCAKCQVFLFDTLLIISESDISGVKNEFLPIKIGDFNVEVMEGLKFKMIIDEETNRVFSAANEEEKGKVIRVCGKLTGQQMEGEKELIQDLRLKTESIDSPQSYYLKDISQLCIYKELPITKEYLEYSEDSNEVKCATFDKLIELLVSPNQFDNLFVYTFLLTYRNFTTPLEVLEKLRGRYNVAPSPPVNDKDFQKFKTDVLLPIRLRIVQVLKLWINRHGRDFRNNPEALEKLNSFIEEMNKTKIGIGGEQLTQTIKKYVNKRDTFEIQLLELAKTSNTTKVLPKPLWPKGIEKLATKDQSDKEYLSKVSVLELIEWPAVEVARQLSLLEFSIFERIQPKECLNQSWNKENRESKAPNIHKMIQQTNTLVNWISNEVLKHERPATRAKSIAYFIELAYECKNLNNFNSMMGVLGGLNSIGVKRLEKSWASVGSDAKKLKAELDEFVSRKKSYGELRQGVKVAQPPILPYIGLYLTDMTFIEDSNKNELNDKINFSKLRRLAKVIREIQTCQQQAYEFQVVSELENKFKNMRPMSEDDLTELSYTREAKQ